MNAEILKFQDRVINGHSISKEEITTCQRLVKDDEDLFAVYWLMARYYLDHDQPDALTYCILKCYELNEQHHFELAFKVKDFMEARTDFMEEAIQKTRTRILPLSILFGLLTLILCWLILGNGRFDAFIAGFIAMNVISIFFQQVGSKKTLAAFKKKQYAAVYGFLDKQDKEFANGH